MAIRTHGEIRASIASTIRDTSINSLITDMLNLTLLEIHIFYPWGWLRRKTTFSTVASQEDYRLDEEVDRIAILRQTTSPMKLIYVPDRLFFKLIPNPEDLSTSNPRFYRLWEETGFTTGLAADDTIQVLSSSTSDGSGFSVRVAGRDTNGIVLSETLTLNGTTAVTSVNTFDAGGLMRVSKSGNTTGVITVRRTTGPTVLIRMAPTESNPRSKILSLYPVPSAVITMNLEYFERVQLFDNDLDVAQMPPQFVHVLRDGALAKLWPFKQNDQMTAAAQRNYEQGLTLMRRDEDRLVDYIPVLEPRPFRRGTRVIHHSDSINSTFPSYGLALP